MDVMFIGSTADGKTRLSHKGVLLTDAGKPYTWAGPVTRERDSSRERDNSRDSSSNGGGSKWYSGPGADGDAQQPRTPRREGEAAGSFAGGRGGYRGRGGGRGRGRGMGSTAE
jgi:hypothetical protein